MVLLKPKHGIYELKIMNKFELNKIIKSVNPKKPLKGLPPFDFDLESKASNDFILDRSVTLDSIEVFLLTAKISELERIFQSAESQLKLNSKLSSQVSDLSNQLETLTAEQNNYESQRVQTNKLLKDSNINLGKAQAKITKLTTNISELKEEKQKLSSDLESQNLLVTSLQSDKTEDDIKSVSLNAEIEILKKISLESEKMKLIDREKQRKEHVNMETESSLNTPNNGTKRTQSSSDGYSPSESQNSPPLLHFLSNSNQNNIFHEINRIQQQQQQQQQQHNQFAQMAQMAQIAQLMNAPAPLPVQSNFPPINQNQAIINLVLQNMASGNQFRS